MAVDLLLLVMAMIVVEVEDLIAAVRQWGGLMIGGLHNNMDMVEVEVMAMIVEVEEDLIVVVPPWEGLMIEGRRNNMDMEEVAEAEIMAVIVEEVEDMVATVEVEEVMVAIVEAEEDIIVEVLHPWHGNEAVVAAAGGIMVVIEREGDHAAVVRIEGEVDTDERFILSGR